jgi:hypothetical protein
MNNHCSFSLAGLLALVASSTLIAPAQAIDFDFSGTFEQDNDVLLFSFTTDADTTATVFSSSWVDGGFDPILTLWDSAGNLLQQQDDGLNIGSTLSNGVSYDHGLWDTYFNQFLTAGSYLVSITQYNNFATGTNLSAGFAFDGVGNESFTSEFGCSQGSFCGATGQADMTGDPNFNRTNAWEFHVLNVAQAEIVDPPPSTSVPEPMSLLSLLVLGGGLALLRRQAY